MLHILLCILKWIGILLLSILGLIILIVLLVLFVPVRYRVKGSYDDKPDASVTVSWLFHLLHIKVRYQDSLVWQLRILGIPFLDSRKPKKERKTKEKQRKKNASKKEKQKEEEHNKNSAYSKVADRPEHTASAVREEASETEDYARIEEKASAPQQKDSPEKPGLIAKIKNFFRKLMKFFQSCINGLRNIRYTIRRICDRIKQIREKIGYYHTVITSSEGRAALGLIKSELGNLLLHIAPRKFALDASFGFEDPATTGQVMAIISTLYPIWRYDISLHPDFERQLLKGKLLIRGRIRIFTVLRIAWRVYFNKNLKKVLVMLQKEESIHV